MAFVQTAAVEWNLGIPGCLLQSCLEIYAEPAIRIFETRAFFTIRTGISDKSALLCSCYSNCSLKVSDSDLKVTLLFTQSIIEHISLAQFVLQDALIGLQVLTPLGDLN